MDTVASDLESIHLRQRVTIIEARLAALEGACGTDLATLEAAAGHALQVTRAPLSAPTDASQPVADTEFPDADTPYSRAIALADLDSLAWTHHKRGDLNISERIEFTAAELLDASKTGWTSWSEDNDLSHVMQKDDGILNSAHGWVQLRVHVRTEGPVVWINITDGDWGTVRDVAVVWA